MLNMLTRLFKTFRIMLDRFRQIERKQTLRSILDDVRVKKAIPENIEVSRKVEAGAKKLIADPDS